MRMIMGKYFLVAAISLMTTACAAQNEQYYKLHPEQLRQAIAHCPDKHPPEVSCEQLADVAKMVNTLAYQLQISPQGFGKDILALQEKIAKQRSTLKKEPNQSGLKSDLDKNEQNLKERLAIVKWLESPES